MMLDDKNIQEILLKGSYVSEEDMKQALGEVKKRGVPLRTALQIQGSLTHELLGQSIGESLGMPYADLKSIVPTKEIVTLIPQRTAKAYRLVSFQSNEKCIRVATDSPKKKGLKAVLKKLFPKQKVAVYYALPDDIDSAFIHYRKALSTSFAEILEDNARFAPEIINTIIEDAVLYRASDVHFEPSEVETIIRFRVDGVLQEAGRIKKDYYKNIVNRLKVQAHLRIDEHNRAQDGAIRLTLDGDKDVDLRMSLIPTLDGEKIVLRVLSEYVREFSMAELGMSPETSNAVAEAVAKPFGMILVVGPTGSGKTTTLYTVLRLLNNPEVNLTTIEDPVEYKVPGINQIQVNDATNLTFSEGLRSIVRQDPDVILVGEIRDQKTAEIAVNAALTGHLMLSTFHANDAATAIPRLIEMGIEPFLLASTLEVVVAQRLVRRICDNCKHSKSMTLKQLRETIPSSAEIKLTKMNVYEGKGCSSCNNTGYRGRVALYEYIPITPSLQELLLSSPSSKTIWQQALAEGAQTLFYDGIEKVKQGTTTLSEVLRVAPPHT